MRLFIDTDILLDFSLGREPHLKVSVELLEWASRNPGQCAVAWHSLANLHYLTKSGAEEFIRDLLKFIEIPSTGSREMSQALALGFSDLEDAMQVSAALLFGAQVIVTRNVKHYRKSPIKVMTPSELLPLLES
jgi:predicted nucleic acid-binding protein